MGLIPVRNSESHDFSLAHTDLYSVAIYESWARGEKIGSYWGTQGVMGSGEGKNSGWQILYARAIRFAIEPCSSFFHKNGTVLDFFWQKSQANCLFLPPWHVIVVINVPQEGFCFIAVKLVWMSMCSIQKWNYNIGTMHCLVVMQNTICFIKTLFPIQLPCEQAFRHIDTGREGGTQQSFVWRGSTPRSNILPFYIPFLTEKVPLLYTFHWKMVPLSHTYLRTMHPFSKPLECS